MERCQFILKADVTPEYFLSKELCTLMLSRNFFPHFFFPSDLQNLNELCVPRVVFLQYDGKELETERMDIGQIDREHGKEHWWYFPSTTSAFSVAPQKK